MAIVTQKISLNLTQSKLPPLIMHTDEQGRRIHFELVDENGDVITLTDDYRARYSQKKPDGNFVSELLSISGDGTRLTLNQSLQMTAVYGISYYDIHVYNGSDIIYSGQGRVVVDDHILDDDSITSISEADGLVFPDDFLTIEDQVAVIDDDASSTESTWSSSKILSELANVNTEIIYSNIAQKIGTWFGADLWKITFVDDIASYVNGSSYFHDLPAGADVVLIEPNYFRYLYEGTWYRSAGYAFSKTQSPQIAIEDVSENTARIEAKYSIGIGLNGSQVKCYYTVYYTLSN